MEDSIYQVAVPTLKGSETTLEEHKGKVLLVVNTASRCGLTPQLDGLESIRQEFKDRGFEILAFPSNDFAGQEPLEGEAIQEFCSTVYGSSFPVYGKIHVKGSKAHPLFKTLSKSKRTGGAGMEPKWNFTKYLIDRNGKIITYFLPITKPESSRVKKAIEKLLSE
ncbi:MAG: glutathione peroxidase [Saprospiraceae bacterium]|nr:glutathione peroxidase [Saprospiraceae bacterium]